jgi:CheY-like chemotaxis protein
MITILVIDDNEANLKLMVFLLNQYSYQTIIAKNGKEGILIAEKKIPDLIICDILMPELNGFEFIKKIKNNKQLKDIPCIAVTAQAMLGDKEKILAAGFEHYIEKPINIRSFVSQVASILQKDELGK